MLFQRRPELENDTEVADKCQIGPGWAKIFESNKRASDVG